MDRSADDRSVHVVEGGSEQLEPLAVGSRKVSRVTVHNLSCDTGRLQLGNEPFPLLASDRDGDVMQATEYFAVLPEVEAGEVEVGEIVVVSNIEKEVGGTAVVPVFEQFDERELEEVLVKGDGSFDIA